MKKSEKEKYKKLLLEKRKQMLEKMSGLNERFDSTLKESTGDHSSYSYHMADQGTDMMEREMAFMQTSKTGRFIYHIDEALRRLETGDYGKCQNCGKQINPERLELVPHARLCIKCKSEEEKQKQAKK